MYTSNLLVACLGILTPLSVASPTSGIEPFTNATVYQPPSNQSSVSYARTEELPGNALLAAWNDFRGGNISDAIPIYRSNDDGRTWKPWGSCKSDKPGRRLVQPHLLYLDEPFGDEEGGVVLLSVNAWDNSSTNIEVYASWNEGKDFEFVSRVATGGRANTTNGATPVWEPFLMRK